MQPIAPSVVQNTRVEQDYRKSDDHYISTDLVVVDAAVLFSEVPDLGSMVAVVLVESILRLLHHTSPRFLDTGAAAEVVVDTGVPSRVGDPQDMADVNGSVDCGWDKG
ncbi:hypothetical protein L2E82_49779 [Cichorium intybus]|uniref:Uncharacterized protein n=1 Tax=Cichorium intybus TaxID=13427 RepID=A0ACB8Z5E3_CICIN|nr:hypothetical protein L2E82_49779 [Cichorium intybus]